MGRGISKETQRLTKHGGISKVGDHRLKLCLKEVRTDFEKKKSWGAYRDQKKKKRGGKEDRRKLNMWGW